MSESVATEPVGRALNPADADQALTILSRHALTVRDATAPSSVTVANGPISLRISWDGASSATVAPEAAAPAAAPVATNGNGSAAHAAAAAAPEAAASDAETFVITADTVGVFYQLPEPGAAPFVAEGDTVAAGQQIGIVEAMKLMIPVTAGRAGRVVEFLVDNGEAVEHGAPLLRLEVIR
ncbi:biotin/lipoyl-containing protein [Nocardia arizonensis]|uniref:biotin/lipoyl-containing protein n=1 Tax=Nocardia arizonensis TaxID=1141647 RepID=UPI0006D2A910|nr:biotin/lipoyl-containing protein [Nocardia arizonensis]